jgi:predicted nuclease with TOPRIM domain
MENQTERQAKRAHFKDRISKMKSELETLAKDAGKLKNKHLADIMLAGIGRLSDALDHPDMDLLSDDAVREEVEKTQAELDKEAYAAEAAERTKNPEPLPFDPAAGKPLDTSGAAFGQTG